MIAKANTDILGIDLKGRVNRLKLAERNMLLPVFEAIVNSIHAIEDTNVPNGKIEIFAERNQQMILQLDDVDKKMIPEIISFTITDNGIGFNDENYESFKREYSTHKAERGGLGIGRFMWLKAFNDVKVESQFYEEKEPTKRSFYFNLKNDEGITKHFIKNLPELQSRKTVVHLLGYKEPYKSKCPKKLSTIAERIIEHCLIYFLNDDCPQIVLTDNEDKIILNDYFNSLTAGNTFRNEFTVN